MGGSLKHHLAILSALVLAGVFCMPLYAQESSAPSSVTADSPSAGDGLAIDETSLRLDDEAAADTLVQNREGSSSAWALVRAILVLAVLAFLVWLLLYFIRRRAAKQAGASPHLKILATTSVALNRHVHVIGLGTKAWLVGSSENAVNLIAEIEDQELIDQLRLEDSRRSSLDATVAGNFSRLFSSLTGKGSAPGAASGRKAAGDSARPQAPARAEDEEGAPGVEALRRARERLSDL